MDKARNVDGPRRDAKPSTGMHRRASTDAWKLALPTLLAACISVTPAPAHAVDGCVVLLCLAAPSWRAVPQCVSPVSQVLRDLARGKPFPTCAMGGAGNSSSHSWSSAPSNCPPQYTRSHDGPNGPIYTCDYSGAISVTVQGTPFATTWWNPGGDTVTEFSATAKTQLGQWDTRFEDDYAKWLASQPAPGAPIN